MRVTTRITAGDAKDPQALKRAFDRAADGRFDCYGTAKLTASATQTTVENEKIRAGAHITITPASASAAAALSGAWWVTTAEGSFVVHHASSAAADMDFSYGWTG